MIAFSASLNLPLEAENTSQIIALMKCSLMSLEKKKKKLINLRVHLYLVSEGTIYLVLPGESNL